MTLLYADVEGSTRLVEELGGEADVVLDTYDELVRTTADEHAGRVVDSAGDSHLLAFESARAAVAAAASLQRALAEREWPRARPSVAVGIHTDEPRAREGRRYSGIAVHRVVRVAALARGGQTLLTGATHQLVVGDLPAGTSLRELGEFELHGVKRPERVFELVVDGVAHPLARRGLPAAQSTLPGGTVTFLFADVEGSTQLLRELGEGWAGGLAAYRRILRETFGEAGGREVDRQGDGFFFVFGRARAAVAAAAEAQRRLAAHDWPDGAEVRVRMGVHTGEPGLEEEGYLGLDVVRAARICAAGHGGQVLLSATTHALAAGEEIEGVKTLDLGEHRLKDMPHPERIHQLVIAGLQARFDPLRTERERPSDPLPLTGRRGGEQLARQVESFVGDLRAEIEQQVADSLREGRAGLAARRKPLPPPEVRTRAPTGAFVLAGFVFLVVVAAALTALYLLVR